MACVLRYFPTQATNFVFKDAIKTTIMTREGSLGSKAVVNIVSGGVAGTLCLLPAYSLDYARTRLAADTRGRGGERQFSGIIDVYTKTLKCDGLRGLYRGFTIAAVGIFIYRGLYFGLYDTLKPLVIGDHSIIMAFLLGWGVTATAGLVVYPIGTIKNRQGWIVCNRVK